MDRNRLYFYIFCTLKWSPWKKTHLSKAIELLPPEAKIVAFFIKSMEFEWERMANSY